MHLIVKIKLNISHDDDDDVDKPMMFKYISLCWNTQKYATFVTLTLAKMEVPVEKLGLKVLNAAVVNSMMENTVNVSIDKT